MSTKRITGISVSAKNSNQKVQKAREGVWGDGIRMEAGNVEVGGRDGMVGRQFV